MGTGRHCLWFRRREYLCKEGTGSHVQPGRANLRIPPTNGDLFQGKAPDGRMGNLGRPPEPKPSANDSPRMSSVVELPRQSQGGL